MENKIDVQENMEVETGGLEEIILKQSEQKRRKKSESTKKSSSNKNIDKSKYVEELNLLIKNKAEILSYKSGKKAFKKRRKASYSNFVEIITEYNANNGIDDFYYSETDTVERDIYLEWLYGVKRFKSGIGINDLSKYNRYSFDFIIDAPYVYHDKITGKTYLYIEVHYSNRIKTFLINSKTVNSENLLYKVAVNGIELDCFKKEVVLSQKLAMLTEKSSDDKYTFYHDSDNKDLFGFADDPYHCFKELLHTKYEVDEFSNSKKLKLKDHLNIFIDVLIQFDLIELWGLLMNYKFAYPTVDYNIFYSVPDKANNSVTANLIYSVLGWLEIEDRIPIIFNPNKKTAMAYKAYTNRNINDSFFNNPNIRGVIIYTNATASYQTTLHGISFQEYRIIEKFLKWLSKNSEFFSMCYDSSDERLYDYLLFMVKYNSTKCNYTSLAAFNGLFYFFNYLFKSGVIKYDVFFKIFKNIFGVDVNKDEVVKLKLLDEDDIFTEVNEDINMVQCESQDFESDLLESDEDDLMTEQQENTVSKQYDESDIEKIYQLICRSFDEKFIKYDDCDKDQQSQIVEEHKAFVKRFKKNNCNAFCFLTEDNDSVKEYLKKCLILFSKDNIDKKMLDKTFDMFYKCVINHNKKINSKTVSKSDDNLVKFNVLSKKKYYVIFLDIDN